MKYTLITFLFISSISFSQWQETIAGNRTLDTLQQEIQKFDEIEVLGPFKITLKKGDHHSITIVGESNLIPHVEVDVNKINSFCAHPITRDFTAKHKKQYKLL